MDARDPFPASAALDSLGAWRRIAISLWPALAVWVEASAAEPQPGCEYIEAQVSAQVDFATFRLAGSVTGDLEGSLQFAGDVRSNTLIPGSSAYPVNPSFSYTGERLIATEDGTLTLRSAGVYESTFRGLGVSLERIIAGTGVFEGTQGAFNFNYSANEDFTTITGLLSGELCR